MFNIEEIKELMASFKDSGLGSVKLKHGDFTLELEKGGGTATATNAIAPVAPAAEAAPAPQPAQASGNIVKSPIVGTFYAAPAPDKPPFVSVGAQVKKGDVLFIIESMKLMNEVTSEHDGTVTEIFAQNGQVVEFGQKILAIG